MAGRGTGGAAVIGFDDPICGVGGTTTTCAGAVSTQAHTSAAASRPDRLTPGEEVFVMGFCFLRGLAKDVAQYSTQNDKISSQND